MIVTLTGGSGSEKSTVGEWLRKRLDDALKPVISITTRERREADPQGEYAYVSREEFARLKREGKFIWDVCPYGTDLYGTMYDSLKETNSEPDTIFLMILEQDAVRTLYLHAERLGLKIASYYILSPPEDELRRRLEKRARHERDKKVSKMRAGGQPEPDIWEWLVQQRGTDQVELEGRIAGSRAWDARALESVIPYTFVRNDQDDTGLIAAATIATEIVERMSA